MRGHGADSIYDLSSSVGGGYLKFANSGAWIAAGLAILYVAVPNRLMDTAFNDVRIVTAAALILPGFVQLSFPNPAWRQIAFWTAAGFAVVNLALVWWVWLSYRPAYAEISRVLRPDSQGLDRSRCGQLPAGQARWRLERLSFLPRTNASNRLRQCAAYRRCSPIRETVP